jgi:subtilisin family serine protease
MHSSARKILLLIFGFALAGLSATGQTAPGKYWVRFTDKNSSPFSLSRPEEFLSWKCIERRDRLGIGFDQRDLPVNPDYIEQVLAMGELKLHHKSKWFNAITIQTEDSLLIEAIRALPIVAEVRSSHSGLQTGHTHKWAVEAERLVAAVETCDSFPEYGSGWRQIQMLNGQWLHSLGYRGAGIDIAQFDAGWNRTDILPVFERLRQEGRIKGVKDFVWNNDSTIFGLNNHGTYVLSIMAAWLPGELVGTAPEANYYLFRTEDPFSEYPVEEDNWVAAAEYADSLGIDVINSSLGYSLFDDPALNHSYADMDGNTTRCSIAADIAASKGILVVNSAGNSGDDPWRYITAPSDADDILCVGAVNADEEHAWFSSYGPSADGQVKPTVSAMGQAAAFAALDSTIATGNGTSFSSPVIAGLSACLIQAFPNLSQQSIRDAIIRSASLYENPNDALGHGIPDFYVARELLLPYAPSQGDFAVNVYPNPCVDHLTVTLADAKNCEVEFTIYDASGRRCNQASGAVITDGHGVLSLDDVVARLPAGHYTLHTHWELRNSMVSFTKIKQP